MKSPTLTTLARRNRPLLDRYLQVLSTHETFLFISQKAAVSKLMVFAPYLSHESLLHLLEAPVIAVPYVGQRLPFHLRNFP